MEYRPTLQSFLSSLVIALSPAATAGVVVYLRWPATGRFELALAGLGVLISLSLVVQSVVVHLTRLHVTDEAIWLTGPLTGHASLRWSCVRQATLRERKNAVTRTD